MTRVVKRAALVLAGVLGALLAGWACAVLWALWVASRMGR